VKLLSVIDFDVIVRGTSDRWCSVSIIVGIGIFNTAVNRIVSTAKERRDANLVSTYAPLADDVKADIEKGYREDTNNKCA